MPPPAKKDLLLVDDHPIILLAVKSLIESKLPAYIPHAAHSQTEALALAAMFKPSLAVVDISLPDGDGLDLIRRLKEISPGCSVLVFSMQSEQQFGARALRAGANGYLMKGDKVSAVIEAIQKIEAGEIYCSPALAQEVMRNFGKELQGGVETLSNREFHIFRLMGAGHSTKEIAQRLEISSKTVDSHRENIKAKLQCHNSTEVLLQARDWLSRNPGHSNES